MLINIKQLFKVPTIVIVQSPSCVLLFAIPWTAACQASLFFTLSQSLLKLMSVESMILSNHLIFCHPFSSCLQYFPATESFPVSQLFAPGGQSIGFWASESILPMNIQSWFPLGLTSLISLLSKGLSRAFRSTTIWKSQFFSTHFLYGPTLTSVYDSWKNHSFDWMDLFRQSDVSAVEYTV